MQSLSVTSKELWPIQARKILEENGVNTEELRESFYQVLYPWDSDYGSENTYFSLRIQQRPLIIIKPNGIQQTKDVLDFVYKYKLTVRIMNGRHSTQIVSPEVLVDISAFSNTTVCCNKIVCGGGSTQGEANEMLFSDIRNIYSHFGHFTHGRFRQDTEAFAGGSATSVGVGGISTVGGIGVLCRSFGLTVDSVLSYTITVPPTIDECAKCIIVDENKNQDLYWALRGGGGNNFGIISGIEYKIIEVPELIQYSITWPWNKAVDVLNYWKRTSPGRPINFNEEIGVSNDKISLNGYYLLNPSDTIETAILNVRYELSELNEQFSGTLTFNTTLSYPQIYKNLVKTRVYDNFSVIQAFFIDDFNSKQIIDYISYKDSCDNNGNRSISFQLLGGVIRDVPKDATAFYPRDANFFMDISSGWNDQINSQENNDWVNIVVKCIIDSKYNKTMYVGFPITYNNVHVKEDIYYGENYERLQKVKKRYDPLNVLTASGLIH